MLEHCACRHLGLPAGSWQAEPLSGRHRAAGSRGEDQRHLAGRARHPVAAEERADHQLPGPHGQRRVQDVQGLPRPAQQHSRAIQGRHSLPRAGVARRGESAGVVDDVQMRAARHPVRRRQGRHQVHAAPALDARDRAHHAAFHARARRQHRPRVRHPRARRRHQRPDHGLDDGHVYERRRLRRQERQPPRGHRQDAVVGRLARARDRDRPGHRPLHHRVGARSPLRAQRRQLHRAGLRQRRLARVEDPGAHRRDAGRDRRLQGLHRQQPRPEPVQARRARAAHRVGRRLSRAVGRSRARSSSRRTPTSSSRPRSSWRSACPRPGR